MSVYTVFSSRQEVQILLLQAFSLLPDTFFSTQKLPTSGNFVSPHSWFQESTTSRLAGAPAETSITPQPDFNQFAACAVPSASDAQRVN